MMGLSKIDQQVDADLREEIYRRFDEGQSVDVVYGFLTGLDIETSRAGVGRYRLNWLKAVKAQREADRMAAMMVRDFEDVPEDKVTRHIGKLVKSGLIRAVTALEEKMEDDPASALEAFTEASKAYSNIARADSYTVDSTVKATEFAHAQKERKALTIDGTGGQTAIEVTFLSAATKKTEKKAKRPTASKKKKAKE